MRVRLVVLEGPDKDKEFDFDQPDRFLVGRSPDCHFQITEDTGISRQHFLLEVNPPQCYIRDNNSANGTFVKLKNQDEFSPVTFAALSDAALIRVGKSILQVKLLETEEAPERFFCIRCAGEITADLEGKDVEHLVLQDFLCMTCKEKESRLSKAVVSKHQCIICKGDVSQRSNLDGRGAELQEIALYLCEPCAEQERRMALEIREYKVLKELGRGGMGVVYKAVHKLTGRVVALKTTLPQCAMSATVSRRFHREMAVMSGLIHPNIVRLIDQGSVYPNHYFVSEYLILGDSEGLVARIYKGPLPVKNACKLACQVLEGLDCAHSNGFVHRDIKPQNILLTNNKAGDMVAKLGDFGLAKNFQEAGNSCFTRTGETMGTLLFMAPEQLINFRLVKPPADLYSIGVTLYYFLTAKYPYNLSHRRDPIQVILEQQPVPILDMNSDIPASLAAVVDKSIRKKPDQRFQTATELREAIQSALP